jgi:hypothetical protein
MACFFGLWMLLEQTCYVQMAGIVQPRKPSHKSRDWVV